MNVHINCRPRNLRNQGAQCARPKARNVRSPRCAMCGVKARNVHNQCVANCTTGWLRMTTKHVHFKNQIFCNIWFSGSRERAIFPKRKTTKSWTCGSEHVSDGAAGYPYRWNAQVGKGVNKQWTDGKDTLALVLLLSLPLMGNGVGKGVPLQLCNPSRSSETCPWTGWT